jgi:hypothetical protein
MRVGAGCLASDRLLIHDRGRVLVDLACAIGEGAADRAARVIEPDRRAAASTAGIMAAPAMRNAHGRPPGGG